MRNHSLLTFVFLSVAAHAAIVGLWPRTEQVTPELQEGTIEIGLISLARVDIDFSRDLRQLQHLAQMVQKKVSKQKPVKAIATQPKADTGQRNDFKELKEITRKVIKDAVAENLNEEVALPTVSSESSEKFTNPVSASKAAPLYAINPAPSYPTNALRYGWEGEVRLKVTVNRSGNVDRIEIEQSSDYHVLDQAALNTVRYWQFEPARIGDTSTEGTVSIPIRFRIKRS